MTRISVSTIQVRASQKEARHAEIVKARTQAVSQASQGVSSSEGPGGWQKVKGGGKCVELARTIYIRYIHGKFGRKITKYTVIYGVYIRFWPTLELHQQKGSLTSL
jgi:hypothetical protein